METVKHMTHALTAGTWWPPCPRAGPGWAWQQLGTGYMLWVGKCGRWFWVRGLAYAHWASPDRQRTPPLVTMGLQTWPP